MCCQNCARLEEELADAKRAIGEHRTAAQLSDLSRGLGVSPLHARMLVKMAAAGRKFTSTDALGRVISLEACVDNNVKVHVWKIRKVVGHDCIETEYGQGYRLSEAFAPVVAAILEPAYA